MGGGNLDSHPHPEPPPLLEKTQVTAQPRTSQVTSLGSRGHICEGGGMLSPESRAWRASPL